MKIFYCSHLFDVISEYYYDENSPKYIRSEHTYYKDGLKKQGIYVVRIQQLIEDIKKHEETFHKSKEESS